MNKCSGRFWTGLFDRLSVSLDMAVFEHRKQKKIVVNSIFFCKPPQL